MAVDFKSEHTRTSEYLFDPADITVKPELNGRKNLPEIETLVDSFVTMGQLQPVLIGRDGGKPVLYDGHRRWRAALEVNRRKLTPKPFKLRCVYYQGDEKAAFLATVIANHERAQTDEIDDANNIAIMGRWGMSEQEISAVYHRDVKWVKDRASLLELCDEGAQAVRDGRMKPSAAVAIAKLSKESQREKLRSVPEGAKITTADAKAGIANGKPKMRPTKETIAFWKPYTETQHETPLSKFARIQTAYALGGDQDEYFRAVRELLGDK